MDKIIDRELRIIADKSGEDYNKIYERFCIMTEPFINLDEDDINFFVTQLKGEFGIE